MRVEDFGVVAAAIFALWLALTPHTPSAWLRAVVAGLALALLAGQLWRQGLHWQLFPALLVLSVAALLMALSITPPYRATMAIAGGILCALSVAACTVFPLFRLPPPTGPYRVGTRTLYLTDAKTHRPLVTQIWYPTAATRGTAARYARPRELRWRYAYQASLGTHALAEAPVLAGAHPLLLFGPMWGGRRTQDTFLAEELASHGYVVAATDHPGNAARIQLEDGSILAGDRAKALDAVTSLAQAEQLWNDELQLWLRDDRFVLASLGALANSPGSWLDHRLDLDRVGAVGHSFGGAAALALVRPLLGQPPADASLPGPVPPVRSAVNLDGWTFAGLDRRTSQPILLVYGLPYGAGAEGQAGAPPAGATLEAQMDRTDRALVDRSLLAYGGTRAWLRGAGHSNFTDLALVSPIHRLAATGPIAAGRAHLLVRSLVLAFFNRTLLGRPTPWPVAPELEVEQYPASR